MQFIVFAIIVLLSLVSQIVSDVVEGATKHTYKETSNFGLQKLSLAGVGVRVKQIGPIAAKVYSTGVYLDKSAISSQCKGLTEYEDALVESSSSKTIVLRMARSVAAETMVSAIGESVRPRMKGKDATALAKFQDVLLAGLKKTKSGGAKEGTVFRFDNSGNNKLTVMIDGATVAQGTISSGALCRAFTSVYLGKDCVSPSLKQSCVKTILAWTTK